MIRSLLGTKPEFVSTDYVLKRYTKAEWLAATAPCASSPYQQSCAQKLQAGVRANRNPDGKATRGVPCDEPTDQDLRCMVDKYAITDALASSGGVIRDQRYSYDPIKMKNYWTKTGIAAGQDASCGETSDDGRITLETADFEACFTPEGARKILEILPKYGKKLDGIDATDCKYDPGGNSGCPELQAGKVAGSSIYAVATSKTTDDWVDQWRDAERYVSAGPCIQIADSAAEFIVHVEGVGSQGSRGTPLKYGGRFRLQSLCTGEYLRIDDPATPNPPRRDTWDARTNVLAVAQAPARDDITFQISNPENTADTGVVKGSRKWINDAGRHSYCCGLTTLTTIHVIAAS